MPLNLEGQTAIVTGAGRGIGKSVALGLADAGARVVAAARTAAELDTLVDTVHSGGGDAIAVPTDISREDDVQTLFNTVLQQTGQVDVVVNNAGIGLFGPTVATSAKDFERVLRINTLGTFLCCREALRHMMPRKRGMIVNIASVVGFRGYPNQVAYTASKHGVMGVTKTIAAEAQEHNIKVSAILPGGVDTDMASQARPDLDRTVLIPPEDITTTILYLLALSDRSAVDQIYIRRSCSKPF